MAEEIAGGLIGPGHGPFIALIRLSIFHGFVTDFLTKLSLRRLKENDQRCLNKLKFSNFVPIHGSPILGVILAFPQA